jgi:hypothetical protein
VPAGAGDYRHVVGMKVGMETTSGRKEELPPGIGSTSEDASITRQFWGGRSGTLLRWKGHEECPAYPAFTDGRILGYRGGWGRCSGIVDSGLMRMAICDSAHIVTGARRPVMVGKGPARTHLTIRVEPPTCLLVGGRR